MALSSGVAPAPSVRSAGGLHGHQPIHQGAEIVKSIRDAFPASPGETAAALMREMTREPKSLPPLSPSRDGRRSLAPPFESHRISTDSSWEKIELEIEELEELEHTPRTRVPASLKPKQSLQMLSKVKSTFHLRTLPQPRVEEPAIPAVKVSGLSKMKSSLALHRMKSQRFSRGGVEGESVPPSSATSNDGRMQIAQSQQLGDGVSTVKAKKSTLWGLLKGGKSSTGSDGSKSHCGKLKGFPALTYHYN
jgi:hypothetical protein